MESHRAMTSSYARVGLLVSAMATACNFEGQYCEGDWATASPEEAPPMSRERVVAQVLATESNAVDMLFVIDDSMSMMDEQEQLGIWSSELFDVLSSSGELPDLHIAVTSSSIAIPGLEQCPRTGGLHVGTAVLEKTRFLSDVASDSGRVRNYTGTLTDTFAKMAKVGDSGCGFEQPFKAARSALTTQGFLRDDALLLVVFVTDEDDCSSMSGDAVFADPYTDASSTLGTLTSYRCFEHGVRCYDGKGSRAFGARNNCRADETSRYVQSVSEFADHLKGLKQDPAQVIVAGIYGKPNHISAIRDERVEEFSTPRLADVCGSKAANEGRGATPAIRMNALMAEFGGRATHSSICERELSWAMRGVGLVTRRAATRSRCLHGALIDSDDVALGIQPTCRVEAVRDPGTSVETRLDVPPCGGVVGTRCFTVEVDAACADTESKLAFRVDTQAENETLSVACDVDLDAILPEPSHAETRALE